MGLWDLHQELSIRAVRGQVEGERVAAEGRQASLQARTDGLEDRVDRLLLVNEAMWELVAERLGVTEDQLAAKIAEIDQRDGALDGRIRRPARRCPSCDAAVPRDRQTCMFCAAPVSGSGPFDAV